MSNMGLTLRGLVGEIKRRMEKHYDVKEVHIIGVINTLVDLEIEDIKNNGADDLRSPIRCLNKTVNALQGVMK